MGSRAACSPERRLSPVPTRRLHGELREIAPSGVRRAPANLRRRVIGRELSGAPDPPRNPPGCCLAGVIAGRRLGCRAMSRAGVAGSACPPPTHRPNAGADARTNLAVPMLELNNEWQCSSSAQGDEEEGRSRRSGRPVAARAGAPQSGTRRARASLAAAAAVHVAKAHGLAHVVQRGVGLHRRRVRALQVNNWRC